MRGGKGDIGKRLYFCKEITAVHVHRNTQIMFECCHTIHSTCVHVACVLNFNYSIFITTPISNNFCFDDANENYQYLLLITCVQMISIAPSNGTT